MLIDKHKDYFLAVCVYNRAIRKVDLKALAADLEAIDRLGLRPKLVLIQGGRK